MKKLITALCLAICSFYSAEGQQKQYTEAGVFFGVGNYIGDLTPQVMEVPNYSAAYGAFARYNFTGKIAGKVHFYKSKLKGSDHRAQITKGHRQRNLSFQSDIYELGIQFEYSFLDFLTSRKEHITTPYIFAGVSGFYFNPQAQIGGQWFDLQPLGTEGQGLPGYENPYSQFAVAIPAGVGVKFNLTHILNIGLEMGVRKTFTDYLDDVSGAYPDLKILQEERGEVASALSYRALEYDPNSPVDPTVDMRGNPNKKDWYFFGGITLSVNIGKASGFSTKQNRPMQRQRKAPKMEF